MSELNKTVCNVITCTFTTCIWTEVVQCMLLRKDMLPIPMCEVASSTCVHGLIVQSDFLFTFLALFIIFLHTT